MKKIFSHAIAVSFLFLFNNTIFCQGIYNAANIVVTGNAFINVQDGGFRNDGNFVPGSGNVIITGIAPNNISSIGGNSTMFINNLIINKKSNGAKLSGNINIDGNLIMQNGNLDLHLFNIDLGNGLGTIINENNHSHITGINGGNIIKTALLNKPISANPGNIGVAISSSANLGNTIIKRNHQQQTFAGGGFGIYRNFDITSSNNKSLNTTLQIFYFDDELAGINKNELGLYERGENENTWTLKGEDKSDTSVNWILKNNIGQLSTFTLANSIKNSLSVSTGNEIIYSVFPNPSSGIFYININIPSAQQSVIGLYDVNGNLLQQQHVQLYTGNNHLQWNIAAMPKGTYFIKPFVAIFPAIKIIKQ